MFIVETAIRIEGLRASEAYAFLLGCTDERYQRWWPGTHLRFHTVRHRPGGVGSLVFMDEYIGRRRVRLSGVVTEAVPGTRIAWQLRLGIALPAWLHLDLEDDGAGVRIRHSLRVGFAGIGRILDPLFRWYFSAGFTADLDTHVRTEFPRLRDLLAAERASG